MTSFASPGRIAFTIWTTTEYRYGTRAVYVVSVLNPARAQPGAQAITLDDRALEGERIPWWTRGSGTASRCGRPRTEAG